MSEFQLMYAILKLFIIFVLLSDNEIWNKHFDTKNTWKGTEDNDEEHVFWKFRLANVL